jgi:hypothetical protein
MVIISATAKVLTHSSGNEKAENVVAKLHITSNVSNLNSDTQNIETKSLVHIDLLANAKVDNLEFSVINTK